MLFHPYVKKQPINHINFDEWVVFNTLLEVDSTNAGRNFADFLAESENRVSRLGVNLIFPVFETYLLQTRPNGNAMEMKKDICSLPQIRDLWFTHYFICHRNENKL